MDPQGELKLENCLSADLETESEEIAREMAAAAYSQPTEVQVLMIKAAVLRGAVLMMDLMKKYTTIVRQTGQTPPDSESEVGDEGDGEQI